MNSYYNRVFTALLSVALGGVGMPLAFAGDEGAGGCAAGACQAGDGCAAGACQVGDGCSHGRCALCGCDNDCSKVCRLVKKDREIKVTCWASECKPFCVPCPSCKGCRNVECVDCSKNCNCSAKKLVWFDWSPGDAKMHNKKVLLKKEVKKKVPGYEWVVEDLCGRCQTQCEQNPAPPAADVPPPPKVGAKLLHGVPLAAAKK